MGDASRRFVKDTAEIVTQQMGLEGSGILTINDNSIEFDYSDNPLGLVVDAAIDYFTEEEGELTTDALRDLRDEYLDIWEQTLAMELSVIFDVTPFQGELFQE